MEGPEMDGCVVAPGPLVVRRQHTVGIFTLMETGGKEGAPIVTIPAQ
jgi:hypothetical protein